MGCSVGGKKFIKRSDCCKKTYYAFEWENNSHGALLFKNSIFSGAIQNLNKDANVIEQRKHGNADRNTTFWVRMHPNSKIMHTLLHCWLEPVYFQQFSE
jgi:hypothetical protein